MKTWMNVAFLFAYVLISALGLLNLKQAAEIASKQFVAGFVLYGAGFVLWLVILRALPLSSAFPLAAGCLVFATQLLGWWLLDEPYSAQQLAGCVFIVFGISLIYLKL